MYHNPILILVHTLDNLCGLETRLLKESQRKQRNFAQPKKKTQVLCVQQIEKIFSVILITLGFIPTCGQIFLTGRLVWGGILASGSCFIPASRVPTTTSTEQPEQRNHL